MIYGGSVSKTLTPGLRIGWMVLPARLVHPFVEAKYAADLGSNVIDQVALAHLMDDGDFDRHLRHAAATSGQGSCSASRSVGRAGAGRGAGSPC